jgi:hypothetical protein
MIKEGKEMSREHIELLIPTLHTITDCSCLENVEASTSHNPVGLHGLLQG